MTNRPLLLRRLCPLRGRREPRHRLLPGKQKQKQKQQQQQQQQKKKKKKKKKKHREKEKKKEAEKKRPSSLRRAGPQRRAAS